MITKADAIVKIFGEDVKKRDVDKAFQLLNLFEKENAPNNYLEEIRRLEKEKMELNKKIYYLDIQVKDLINRSRTY
jgi:hypothetical protein